MARKLKSLWLSAIVIVGALALAPAAQAQDLYVLNEGSSYVEGCIPPCLCPALFSEDLRGTFVLTQIPSPYNGVDAYRVSDVNLLKGVDEAESHVTGRGFYGTITVGGVAYQRLLLRLSFDGGALQTFDTGIQISGARFPDIVALVSPPNGICYTIAFNIDASPAGPEDFVPYVLGDAANFQEGCISSPCDCAVFTYPMGGTYDLVPLGNRGMWAEYAVVNVNWAFFPGDELTRVGGVGFYRQCLTCFLPAHQLFGRFRIGNTGEHFFNSGFVNGGESFPFMAIDFDRQVDECIDQLFQLTAGPIGKF